MLVKFQGPGNPKDPVRILSDWNLFFSKPKGLNDPYENYPELRTVARKEFDRYIARRDGLHIQRSWTGYLSLWSSEYRARLKERQKFLWAQQPLLEGSVDEQLRALTNHYGVFCAADIPDVLGPHAELMWAHYGRSHTGIAIELDASHRVFFCDESPPQERKPGLLLSGCDTDGLLPVKYSEKRPRISPLLSEPSNMHACLLAKSKVWQYENERRCIKFLASAARYHKLTQEENGLLVTGDPTLVRRVYLGALASKETKNAVNKALAQSGTQDIEIVTLRLSARTYRLEIASITHAVPQEVALQEQVL